MLADDVYASAERFSSAFSDLGVALNKFMKASTPLDVVARSWPVYISEYGDVMCGQEGCPCDCESSVIYTPWADGEEWPQWSAQDLLGAIEEHIEWGRRKQEEEED